MKKIYCFDIDGTLCTNTDGQYEKAVPFDDVIAEVNRLFELGHKVILFTARGTTTGIDWREFTAEQMKRWGVNYHELHLGKPNYDVCIDDKSINAFSWRKANFRMEIDKPSIEMDERDKSS